METVSTMEEISVCAIDVGEWDVFEERRVTTVMEHTFFLTFFRKILTV